MSATAIAVQPAIAIHPGQANSLHLTEIPRDEPGPGEVLVRVRQVGICGTDRELIEALPLAEFNPHVSAITPPQGVKLARGIPPDRVLHSGTTLYDRRHRARDPTIKDTVRTAS